MWSPAEPLDESLQIVRYMRWLERERGLVFRGYDELQRWSVRELEAFWASLWDFFEVRASVPYTRVLARREMPGAVWFEGARLNYSEHVLGPGAPDDELAVLARSQTRGPFDLTYGDLRERVAAAREGLRRLGVGPGDRVVGNLPNIPEALIAFHATASLGAIWAVCPPEFGARGVIDRFAALEPKVFLAVAGYTYGEKPVDRRAAVATIRKALPGLEHVVHVPYGGGEADALPSALGWDELLAHSAPLEFEQVAFDHPLWVLFSSGTTGLPKAIVQGHGGILLEHFKNLGLSWDQRPGDRLLWFTTTAWMMWNALISALLLRSSIVMLDGNPLHPGLTAQWELARELRPTLMGVSPALLMACRKEGVDLREYDLSSVRQLCAAGSPLPPEGYDWVYEQFGRKLLLNVGSGGTDVCSGIVQGGRSSPSSGARSPGRCSASTLPHSTRTASR
jgi:acetoacetyl-CoA synthetase